MDTPGLIAVGLAIALGLVGIVVAAIPGLILVWGAVLVWALVEQDRNRLGRARNRHGRFSSSARSGSSPSPAGASKRQGSPTAPCWLERFSPLIGFFVIPVVGFVIGFVLGVYLSERQRLGSHHQAWPSTTHALKAAGSFHPDRIHSWACSSPVSGWPRS